MSSTFDCLLQREQKVDYNSLFLTLACMLTHTDRERKKERENSSFYLSMNASCPIVMFFLCPHSLFLSNEHMETWKKEYDLPFTTGRTHSSNILYNAVASLKVIVNLKMNILSFLLIYFYRKRNSSPKNKNSAKMLTYVYQWNN